MQMWCRQPGCVVQPSRKVVFCRRTFQRKRKREVVWRKIEPSSTKARPILIKALLVVEAMEVHRLVEDGGTLYSLAVEQSRGRWTVDGGNFFAGVEFRRKGRTRNWAAEIERKTLGWTAFCADEAEEPVFLVEGNENRPPFVFPSLKTASPAPSKPWHNVEKYF